MKKLSLISIGSILFCSIVMWSRTDSYAQNTTSDLGKKYSPINQFNTPILVPDPSIDYSMVIVKPDSNFVSDMPVIRPDKNLEFNVLKMLLDSEKLSLPKSRLMEPDSSVVMFFLTRTIPDSSEILDLSKLSIIESNSLEMNAMKISRKFLIFLQ